MQTKFELIGKFWQVGVSLFALYLFVYAFIAYFGDQVSEGNFYMLGGWAMLVYSVLLDIKAEIKKRNIL